MALGGRGRCLVRDGLVFKPILSGHKDGFDALKIGPWRVGQRPGASSLKAANAVFVGKLQEGHTTSVALLFDPMRAQEGLHSGACVRTDLLSPGDETLRVPLDKLLVILRHMSFHRAVLSGFPVKP